MNTLLLEHCAAVSKIAAYRQSRERQHGVKMGYGDSYIYTPSFTGKALTSPSIPIGTSDFSIEYYGNAYGSGSGSTPLLVNRASLGSSGSSSYFQVYGLHLGYNGLNWVTFGVPDGGNIATDSLNFNYSAPDLSAKFHLVVSRQGRMINVYIDNILIASKEQTEIKDMGAFALCVLNSSDVGFVRVWNYALSAEDVAALYNNGNPAGYVLPAYTRKLDKSVELAAPESWLLYGNITYDSATGEFHIVSDGTYSALVLVDNKGARLSRTDCIYQLRFKIKGSGSIAVVDGGSYRPEFPLSTVVATDDYVEHVVLLSFPEANSIALKRQAILDVYVKDIEVSIVGCVAEYLPQNLVANNNGLVSSWLDSAKQLPLNDEYLPPLLETAGGYDLAANGTPEIVYKPE